MSRPAFATTELPTAFTLEDTAPAPFADPTAFAMPGIISAQAGIGAAQTQVLYLTEAGDSSAISVNDIHQGQIGDCFLLSSIGELAIYKPALISAMIKTASNGTENVTLYTDSKGHVPGFGTTAYKASTQNVTNSFSSTSVNNGATQDVVGTQKEIWVQVLEKAYAQANGGYAGIQNGGNPCIAMEELTGYAATPYASTGWTTSTLNQMIGLGDLIVMDTATSNSTYNLVGNHAYMFEGLQTVNGAAYVKAGNPWGFDQPNLIPLSKLSTAFAEIDVGRTH